MVYSYKLVSVLMLALIGLTLLVTLSPFGADHKTVAPLSDLPDAFMENVTVLIFDKQGKPKMKIAAPKMVHYTNNDTTQLNVPTITLYRQSPQPWYITSHYAEAKHGADQVDFRDNVVVQHAADINAPATIIKTETLTILPNIEIAETQDAITMTQPNIVIHGIGMRANIQSGDIQLLSQARGEYVPSF